ncbi:uncharacterized protein [Rutidosis leptorrhynchoides]|uniref:uncharacterized protein n=1 Tax=Rutidosis leptorrhynchoides TaxID=125765 RepID=UPI003A992B7E
MATYDKVYTVTSISNLIPIKLDLSKLNYPHWSKLFSVHCEGFKVGKFIITATTPEELASATWRKADAVVQMWIYSTISESLLERLLNSDSTNAFLAWLFLKKNFQDNKRSKTLELTAELRNITIVDQTVEEYFRSIDKIATQLKNLGSTVSEPDLVTYAVNDFKTVRSMLKLEELQLNRKNHTSSSQNSIGTPSSPSVLLAQAAPPSPQHPRPPQVCRNFNRGSCCFGEKCRYLHQPHRTPAPNTSGNGSSNFIMGTIRPNNNHNSQAQLLGIIQAQQQFINKYTLPKPNFCPPLAEHVSPPGFPTYPQANYVGPGTVNGSQQAFQPNSAGQSQVFNGHGHTSGPNTLFNPQSGFFSHQPAAQETVIPQAFTATTLPDYGNTGWTMDTGATTHLTSSIKNLSTIFDHCMYLSIYVGDGKSIPVINTGHSILPNPNRPLYLNNVLFTPDIVKNLISVRHFTRDNKVSVSFDEFGFSVKNYLTSHLLLRCDSTGDFYPFTSQPASPTHHALLTSSSIWHQRLGHRSIDVFRHLISNNSIACNETKSPVLCHACQLGKHVRLPFDSSVSHVTSLFDIVHSDLWTSPVPSLSSYKYYVIFLDYFSHYLWV